MPSNAGWLPVSAASIGISQEDAARLEIGWHAQRKKVCFTVRNPDASLSGFIGCDAGMKLNLPLTPFPRDCSFGEEVWIQLVAVCCLSRQI
jgi:hypothetical protein